MEPQGAKCIHGCNRLSHLLRALCGQGWVSIALPLFSVFRPLKNFTKGFLVANYTPMWGLDLLTNNSNYLQSPKIHQHNSYSDLPIPGLFFTPRLLFIKQLLQPLLESFPTLPGRNSAVFQPRVLSSPGKGPTHSQGSLFSSFERSALKFLYCSSPQPFSKPQILVSRPKPFSQLGTLIGASCSASPSLQLPTDLRGDTCPPLGPLNSRLLTQERWA